MNIVDMNCTKKTLKRSTLNIVKYCFFVKLLIQVASTISRSSVSTGIESTLIMKLTIPTALFLGITTLKMVITKLKRLKTKMIEVTYSRATYFIN